MTDHPTPAVLEGFLRGELSPAESRTVVAHMLQGCARCRQALAPGSATLFSPSLPEAEGDGAEYDFAIQRALAVAKRRAAYLARERELAGKLRLVPDRTLPSSGDRERARCESLLEAGRSLRYRDPGAMTMVSGLAVAMAERLDGATGADLQAEAWAELGNARRIANDHATAEGYLDRALARAEAGSGSLLLLARIMDLTASLYIDQRRFAEAVQLLDRVYEICRDQGERHLAGRALISKGIAIGYGTDPEEAIRLLDAGLALIDRRSDPSLAFVAVHNLIDCKVRLGRYEQAQRLLARSRRLYREYADELNLLKLRWVEGLIDRGLGAYESAEAAFREVRRGYEERDMPFFAALASLDLAMVWFHQGRCAKIGEMVEEMLQTFRAMRIPREAIASLLMLREAVVAQRTTVQLLQTVAAELQRMERDLGNGPI